MVKRKINMKMERKGKEDIFYGFYFLEIDILDNMMLIWWY